MKNLTVKTKFFVLIAFILTAGTGLLLLGLNRVSLLNNNFEDVYTSSILPSQSLNNISREYSENIEKTFRKIENGQLNTIEGVSIINRSLVSIDKLWLEYNSIPKESKEYQLASDLKMNMANTNAFLKNYLVSIVDADESSVQKFNPESLISNIEPLKTTISELQSELASIASKYREHNNSEYSQSYIILFIVLAIGFIITLFLALSIMSSVMSAYNQSIDLVRSIAKTKENKKSKIEGALDSGLLLLNLRNLQNKLKIINESMLRIANGDLTVELNYSDDDEIGKLMKSISKVVNNLKEVVGATISTSNYIASTSTKLSTNSQIISEGASEQASSVEEIAASMEEISVNILQNAKNAEQTELIASMASTEFENGRENIDITVDSIKTIASKISIIGEIAFQTNILALNAAVEAARAGEHGKGFGVVASEVGKLAERTKIAAFEIDNLSKAGVQHSKNSKDMLTKALPNINETLNSVKEINVSSNEQSLGVEQINMGIQSLNQVTQQNAASSQEMANESKQLARQAKQLKSIISYFKISNEPENYKTNETPPQYFISDKTKNTHLKDNTEAELDFNLDRKNELDSEFESF